MNPPTTPPAVVQSDASAVISDIIRDVCELPGDTDPNDPDYVCMTVEELRIILDGHISERRTRLALGEGELREAVKPWADFCGDLPDYDHPLRCVYESGIQYAVELLAKELGVEDYEPCDGTEEFDGDLGGTLINIVKAAGSTDEHGDYVHPRELRERALAHPDPLAAGASVSVDGMSPKVLSLRLADCRQALHDAEDNAALAHEAKRAFSLMGDAQDMIRALAALSAPSQVGEGFVDGVEAAVAVAHELAEKAHKHAELLHPKDARNAWDKVHAYRDVTNALRALSAAPVQTGEE